MEGMLRVRKYNPKKETNHRTHDLVSTIFIKAQVGRIKHLKNNVNKNKS
jgi:hypothetical protein